MRYFLIFVGLGHIIELLVDIFFPLITGRLLIEVISERGCLFSCVIIIFYVIIIFFSNKLAKSLDKI